ncbi:MAG: DUF4118 domain-containing protein [Planctomycetaceae bacterium]
MADLERATPEQMLARLQSDGDDSGRGQRRGRLKVFFGYAAGVGKTYAMLQEARRLAANGTDVVAGYVEPHGREETESLLEGLEQLPTLKVEYRGATLAEFDLDAALERSPEVILVDELAHSNPPRCRHPKRWQDIDELLNAGISVLTTCNVQHIESLNDVVAKISGVTVRETVPDQVFQQADELAVIDISPENLLERLEAGKVYVPTQARRALQNFFRRDNLVALRELALRQTAERVHADVQTARTGQGRGDVWATNERLLVCIGPSPSSAKVVRSARRLANSLGGELVAIHVERGTPSQVSEPNRTRLLANLRLAEQLGAETVTLIGDDVVDVTLEYAKRRNVTKIVIGKTEHRGLPWNISIPDRLIRDSGDIDVYVIRGASEPLPDVPVDSRSAPVQLRSWFATAAVLTACTGLSLLWSRLGLTEANIVMTYLLGVVVVSAKLGRGQSIFATAASVLLFDVFFTEPYFTVAVKDAQYLVTFVVLLIVGVLIATLTGRIRRQVEIARGNEQQTESLYRLNKQVASLTEAVAIAEAGEAAITQVFGAHAVVFLPQAGTIRPIPDHLAAFASDASEIAVAQWVYDHGEPAGHGTNTLPATRALFLPLRTPTETRGVLAIHHDDQDQLLVPGTRHLLETYAAQIGSALERVQLMRESQSAQVRAETERLRSTMLASVSHDIRTPLAVIAGAASSLREQSASDIDEVTRRELLGSIYDESDRLSRLVENLLRLTQLSAGKFQIEKDWHPIEDVIGSALRRLEKSLRDHSIKVDLPENLLLGQFDAVLIEQVLINLLENAARYTPQATEISVKASPAGRIRGVTIEVSDHGAGLEVDEIDSLFETFQRGRNTKSDSRGAGLGLAICRAIVAAHGGTITARNRSDGKSGAIFEVTLPYDSTPPRLELEEKVVGT